MVLFQPIVITVSQSMYRKDGRVWSINTFDCSSCSSLVNNFAKKLTAFSKDKKALQNLFGKGRSQRKFSPMMAIFNDLNGKESA